MSVYLSHSAEETREWAKQYARSLRPGDTVLLNGEMGAGKTILAQGIAAGLGVREAVTSPTYAYVNSYGDMLYHFDCYRVASLRQAYELGLADYFTEEAICLVEWGENIAELLPAHCKTITLLRRGENEREIHF